jgi:hypothetical protein
LALARGQRSVRPGAGKSQSVFLVNLCISAGGSGVFNLAETIWVWWNAEALLYYVVGGAVLGWVTGKLAPWEATCDGIPPVLLRLWRNRTSFIACVLRPMKAQIGRQAASYGRFGR